MKKQRELYLKKMINNCFEYKEYNLDDFTKIVKHIFPIFGTLEVEIIKDEDGYNLKYIDKDIYFLEDKEIDMSTSVLNLSLNNEGVIDVIEHSYQIFTPANKNEVMFCASIIGKKIIL